MLHHICINKIIWYKESKIRNWFGVNILLYGCVWLQSIPVKSNDRYRFRTINTGGVSQCPLEIKVQGHDLTIIAIDGHAVEPKLVDFVQVDPGSIIYNKYAHGVHSSYTINMVVLFLKVKR